MSNRQSLHKIDSQLLKNLYCYSILLSQSFLVYPNQASSLGKGETTQDLFLINRQWSQE